MDDTILERIEKLEELVRQQQKEKEGWKYHTSIQHKHTLTIRLKTSSKYIAETETEINVIDFLLGEGYTDFKELEKTETIECTSKDDYGDVVPSCYDTVSVWLECSSPKGEYVKDAIKEAQVIFNKKIWSRILKIHNYLGISD